MQRPDGMTRPAWLEGLNADRVNAMNPGSTADSATAGVSLEYVVRICGSTERIRIAIPGWLEPAELPSLGRFAVTTAWLRYIGLLPRNSTNGVE
jgi:hypothetical protein